MRVQGLKVHGVLMLFFLVKFLVELLMEFGEVVVDPFGGSFIIVKVVELLGCRWFSIECMVEYVIGSVFCFMELFL